MAEKNFKVRYFFVGEDESLHRIPFARYQHIFHWAQAITLYAGKSFRFIEAVVEHDGGRHEELVHGYFLRHQFDEHVLWDEHDKDQCLRGAMEAVSRSGKARTSKKSLERSISIHSDESRLLTWWNG